MVSLFLSLDFIYQLILTFFTGFIFASLVFIIINYNKNQIINAYKRQVEKGSVISDESSARVKVLEQKIEVLEKALENALNK